jgi:hypothetical protein
MLAAADALRSYTESSSHELDLPIEVFGEPTVRTLRLRPSATRKDHREWRLMDALGGERLQDLIRRWKKIQSAVDQEVERRLKAALRDGA